MADTLCAVIPVYNNPLTIAKVVQWLHQSIGDVVIANDGGNTATRAIIDQLAATDPQRIHAVHLPRNRGKGAAVKVGLQHALQRGFSHALQVDADDQHDLNNIPAFLARHQQPPNALILGAPVFGDDIPAIRKHGRKLTQWMIALETGTTTLPDAMCGFRLYPLATICALPTRCSRMCYDPEILIRAYWADIPIETVPTRVRYLTADQGGVSHFRSVHDNLLNIGLHSWLTLQAPYRWLQRTRQQHP